MLCVFFALAWEGPDVSLVGCIRVSQLVWLPLDPQPVLAWDSSMCVETSKGAAARELFNKALRVPLSLSEVQVRCSLFLFFFGSVFAASLIETRGAESDGPTASREQVDSPTGLHTQTAAIACGKEPHNRCRGAAETGAVRTD